jgi:hypothetical protein
MERFEYFVIMYWINVYTYYAVLQLQFFVQIPLDFFWHNLRKLSLFELFWNKSFVTCQYFVMCVLSKLLVDTFVSFSNFIEASPL